MSGRVSLGYWDTQVAGLGRMVRKEKKPKHLCQVFKLTQKKGEFCTLA